MAEDGRGDITRDRPPPPLPRDAGGAPSAAGRAHRSPPPPRSGEHDLDPPVFELRPIAPARQDRPAPPLPPSGTAQPSSDEGPSRRSLLNRALTVTTLLVTVLGVAGTVAHAVGGSPEPNSTVTVTAAPAGRGSVLTLSGLLDDGAADRSAVEDAVAAVVTCKRRLVGPRVQDLREATHHGRTLLRQLTALPVQDVPRGADLVARVRQTWTAWQAAERHYLTWASRIDDGGRCTQWSGEKLMGDREAKRAQRAEAGLVRFWNASVAPAYGLPPRSTPGG